MEKNLKDVARKTKEASYFLANISSFHKDQFLLQLADNLERDEEEIKAINKILLDGCYRIKIKEDEDFYSVFLKDLPNIKNSLGII